MYVNGSEEFNKAIDDTVNTALHHRLVFTDDNSVIESISKLNGYISSNNTSELQIGTTNMSYVEVEAYTDKILTGREFRLESGARLEDGTYEYAPIGYFTVQKPDGDLDIQTFKAFDRMQKFERPYSSSLTEPTTTDKILVEICEICRVTLATPIPTPIEVAKIPQGYTCREVLGYIAGLHSKFACFDRFGELNLRWYSETPIEKKIGVIWSFTRSQENFTVEKIEIAKDGETNYTSGSGYKTVFHSNPLATQEITDSIMATLNGFTYNASSIEMLDDIRLDPWDVIKVTYLDGNTYLVPCMAITQNFSDGSTVVQAYAKSDTENEYRFTGPTIQFLNRMATELLVANRVIATKVDAEYVQSHAITTDNLDAITANITNLVVDKIDGKYADIHLANIDIADIGLFFANSGLLKDVTIVEGHITGELDAVRINADVITTGTLSVDRLLVTGKDSIVYQINVDSSGLSETELEKEVYQKYLNGTDIVANSITATQLNVSQIFADETVTSTLFAQDIVAIGSITSPLLKSDDYVYDGETFDGEEYSTSGMIIDLREKIIRTPKFCLKNDGSMYASEIHGGRYYGLTSTETAFIFNGFTGGTKETTDLLKVSGNTADGTTYTTYIDTDNDNFSFYKSCLFPYGIQGNLTIEGNTTFESHTTFKGQLIAEQGMYVYDTYIPGWGSTGYIVLARVEVKGAWLSGDQIRFKVRGHAVMGEIILTFSNTGTVTDTTVAAFTQSGNLPQVYYVFTKGTNSVTVDIILYKGTYQYFQVINWSAGGNHRGKLNVTFSNTFETTLRSGAVAATAGSDYFQNAMAYGDVIAGYGTDQQFSLIELFNDLGRLNTVEVYVSDANNIKKTCFMLTAPSSTNVMYKDDFLLTFAVRNGNCLIQINVSRNGQPIVYRTKWYTTWTDWKTFT